MFIEKRNKEITQFDRDKIVVAIKKATFGGDFLSPTELKTKGFADKIAQEIELEYSSNDITPTVSDVENRVYFKLVEKGYPEIAKSYEAYRSIREHIREENTTDKAVIGLLNYTNKDVMNENSNKNPIIASTQRDLIAGEISKDIAKRKILPPNIVQAHNDGAIHVHK